MKKMMTLVMMMTIAISAHAFTYAEARNEAMYLTDKMAHELRLTPAQFDMVYDINLDYLRSVNPHSNAFGSNWVRRNDMLRNVLTMSQYSKYMHTEHFYRPMAAHPTVHTMPSPKKPVGHAPTKVNGHNNRPAHR